MRKGYRRNRKRKPHAAPYRLLRSVGQDKFRRSKRGKAYKKYSVNRKKR